MLYAWLVCLVVLNGFWWALTFYALPGNWLIVISTCFFAWWQWDKGLFSLPTLVIITILAVLGEIIEFLSGMGGAKKAGAGKRGALGAILGAVAGAILGTVLLPIPFLGTLIGACAGAAAGTILLEMKGGKKIEDTVRLGLGAGLGVLYGTGSKLLIGIIICIIVAVAAFVS